MAHFFERLLIGLFATVFFMLMTGCSGSSKSRSKIAKPNVSNNLANELRSDGDCEKEEFAKTEKCKYSGEIKALIITSNNQQYHDFGSVKINEKKVQKLRILNYGNKEATDFNAEIKEIKSDGFTFSGDGIEGGTLQQSGNRKDSLKKLDAKSTDDECTFAIQFFSEKAGAKEAYLKISYKLGEEIKTLTMGLKGEVLDEQGRSVSETALVDSTANNLEKPKPTVPHTEAPVKPAGEPTKNLSDSPEVGAAPPTGGLTADAARLAAKLLPVGGKIGEAAQAAAGAETELTVPAEGLELYKKLAGSISQLDVQIIQLGKSGLELNKDYSLFRANQKFNDDGTSISNETLKITGDLLPKYLILATAKLVLGRDDDSTAIFGYKLATQEEIKKMVELNLTGLENSSAIKFGVKCETFDKGTYIDVCTEASSTLWITSALGLKDFSGENKVIGIRFGSSSAPKEDGPSAPSKFRLINDKIQVATTKETFVPAPKEISENLVKDSTLPMIDNKVDANESSTNGISGVGGGQVIDLNGPVDGKISKVTFKHFKSDGRSIIADTKMASGYTGKNQDSFFESSPLMALTVQALMTADGLKSNEVIKSEIEKENSVLNTPMISETIEVAFVIPDVTPLKSIVFKAKKIFTAGYVEMISADGVWTEGLGSPKPSLNFTVGEGSDSKSVELKAGTDGGYALADADSAGAEIKTKLAEINAMISGLKIQAACYSAGCDKILINLSGYAEAFDTNIVIDRTK